MLNCSSISQYIHYLQKESTHFSLEVSTHCGRGAVAHFAQKLIEFIKGFELYQVFVYNYFLATCPDTHILCNTDAH